MERKALYAGSFDPVTNGHLNIIERAAGMYDSLTVAIAVNPHKTGFFTIDERAEIARKVTSHIPNVKVDTFEGLLADYVNKNGFIAYVRGLRATTDFENELQMAQMNALLFTGDTETVFLMEFDSVAELAEYYGTSVDDWNVDKLQVGVVVSDANGFVVRIW